MTVAAKICGVNSREALDAAVAGGAAFVGFVFYARSPRYLTVPQAATLAAATPKTVKRTGLFVDVDDATIETVLKDAPLELLQFHGAETPARCRAVKARFGVPVMKAVKIGGPDDLAQATPFFDAADWLLFDAKTPPAMTNALPGGNAVSFDWTVLAGAALPLPWMLSGGLTPDNVAEAVRVSGAGAVDVSSGVESAPGRKDPARIAAFLAAIRGL